MLIIQAEYVRESTAIAAEIFSLPRQSSYLFSQQHNIRLGQRQATVCKIRKNLNLFSGRSTAAISLEECLINWRHSAYNACTATLLALPGGADPFLLQAGRRKLLQAESARRAATYKIVIG